MTFNPSNSEHVLILTVCFCLIFAVLVLGVALILIVLRQLEAKPNAITPRKRKIRHLAILALRLLARLLGEKTGND